MDKPLALVLAAGSLGDSILTLPALQALQSRSKVTVAGTPPYLALGALLLGVEEIGPLDSLLQALLYDGSLDEKDRQFLAGFHEAFIFFKAKDERLLKKLTTIGGLQVRQPAKPFGEFLSEGRWAAEYWLETVLPGPLPDDSPWRQARLQVGEPLKEKGRWILDRLGLSLPLVIHPGSGSPSKNAPLTFFREAAQRAGTESQKQVLVVWGEAETRNLAAIRQAFAGLGNVRVLPEPLTLIELVGVFSQSAAYLGNDSGVTHLAAACGLRTFALFNATDANVWGPRANSIVLSMLKGNLH